MTFNIFPEDQLLNHVDQQIAALDQNLANIFPEHLNPYGGDGFIANQINFNEGFLDWGWQQAQALAAASPDGQPIPGFGTADLVATNLEAQGAFDNYFGALQSGSIVNGDAWGNIAGAIGGYWGGTTLDGTLVTGVSNDFSYAGVDPFGNVISSNEPFVDPNIVPVTPWSEVAFF